MDWSGFAVPEAKAEGPSQIHTELGIAAILVENDLLDDRTNYTTEGSSSTLREHIFTYAENIQRRLPHTRAIVIGIGPDESTYKISTVLEKLYYEGADNDLLDDSKFNDDFVREDDNRLAGIVLVGDVPTPIIYEKDGIASPSLYPYTDFYRKRYIYNHETDHFEFNKGVSDPTPDIWHGVIMPPSKNDAERRQELADYFYKNNQYSNNLGEYNTFDKRLLYYNFPAVEKQLNTLDYQNYKRYIKYLEELSFRRYNRHLLRDVMQNVAEDLEPDKPPEERMQMIDDESIGLMSDTVTKFMTDKYVKNFAEALQIYLGKLNPIIARTGRWSESEFDSLASLVAMRDAYMQNILMGKTVALEDAINDAIETAQQDVNILDGITVSIEEDGEKFAGAPQIDVLVDGYEGGNDALEELLLGLLEDADDNGTPANQIEVPTEEELEEEGLEYFFGKISFFDSTGGLVNLELYAFSDGNRFRFGAPTPGIAPPGSVHTNPSYVQYDYTSAPPVPDYGISSVAQCGLMRGQKRPPGVPVLENNSVLVQANRTYNANAPIEPPEDNTRELTDMYPYNVYGGCTSINAIANSFEYENDDGDTVHESVGPHKCNPRSAINTVYDIAGSKELELEFYDPSIPYPGSAFGGPLGSQCNIEDISYNPNWIMAEGHYKDYWEWLSNYKTPFWQNAFCKGSFPFNLCFDPFFGIQNPLNGSFRNWIAMTTYLFVDMVDEGIIQFDMTDPQGISEYMQTFSQPHLQMDKIISALFNPNTSTPSSRSHTMYYDGEGIDLTFVFDASYKTIHGVIEHREPTDETINNIENYITPNTPADGIRYVEWHTGGGNWVHYKYPNLFKLEGKTVEEVTTSLFDMIAEKDAELNALLGEDRNVIANFILEDLIGVAPSALELEDIELLEPVIWRQIGIDQKHEMALEKYINRDSFMPIANPAGLPPTVQPEGYEVLHLYADGDEKGFNFAINSSRLTKAELKDSELDGAEEALAEAEAAAGDDAAEGAEGEAEFRFTCGPADGVEIWEWFGAVMCWIDEEISKLGEMITMDDSCGGEVFEAVEKCNSGEDEDGDGDVDCDDGDCIDDPNCRTIPPGPDDVMEEEVPVELEIEIERTTLVWDEYVPIDVTILNSDSEKIIGYIEDPLTFNLADGSLGHFDKDELPIFIGEGRVNLVAENQTGDTELNIGIGALNASPIPIRVVDGINVNLEAAPGTEPGKPSYNIIATLSDTAGNQIEDISTKIRLTTLKPADGIFVNNGLVEILNGHGEGIYFPSPASLESDVTANHPVYTSDVVHVTQPPNLPFKIIIDSPKYLQIAETTEVPIKVTDVNDVVSSQFNGPINVKITSVTKKFGDLTSETINIINGEGAMEVNVGSNTGQINFIASHDDLAPGIAKVPVIARVTNEEMAEMFPQNLFASFAGFPAGNFLEEDYFAGKHLFSGKTQAAFAFMSTAPIPPTVLVYPNYRIQTFHPQHIVRLQPLGDEISLQVIDQSTLMPLLSTIAPLDFENVSTWDEQEELVSGTLYFDLTNDNFYAKALNDTIDIFDRLDEKILTIHKDQLQFHKLTYELFYELEPDFDLMELVLADQAGEVGRLRLNFKPRHLNPNDFEKHQNFAFRRNFSGNSTEDPTGLILFDTSEEIDEKELPPENFGFEDGNKYILRFGGGSPTGEATMFNLPYNAVLLGDPTIQLENHSTSSLNYDGTIGRQIFQDPEGNDVAALTNFDFNRDNIQDSAVVMKNGRIRLFEGAATDPLYRDRGNMAFLADGAINIIDFDFKNDGYEDLLVATRKGRLAVLHNDGEVITRTDQKIKIGKQLYQISKSDMDADGFFDLVTLDSRGDIRIFYNQSKQLLAQGATLPIPAKDQIPENGMLIGNYGFSLQLGRNLKRDLQLRYPGMPEPEDPSARPPSGPPPPPPVTPAPVSEDNPFGLPNITIPDIPDFSAIIEFPDVDTSDSVSESEAEAHREALDAASEAFEETGEPPGIPKLPWREGEESQTYFEKLDGFTSPTGLYITANKQVVNRDRPTAKDLDLGEPLKYTITLSSNQNVNDFVLADTVPDSLTLNEDSVACEGPGCEEMEVQANSIYLFISNLDLKANQQITITYETEVKHTPKAAVMIQRIDADTQLEGYAPRDIYMDILVSPPYNTTGQLMAHHTVAPRTYSLTTTAKEEDPIIAEAWAANMECVNGLSNIDLGGDPEDEDYEPPEDFEEMMRAKLDSCPEVNLDDPSRGLDGSVTPTPAQCAANPEMCASSVMDDLADGINDFACMGGGCFPMPVNLAFMSPQGIPFAMPIISFPATNFIYVPAPVPIPFPAFFGMVPLPLGATTIPGPFNSMVRLYLIPTLTGGMAIAVCWSQYMGEMMVPPPLIPIPYPPPIGNCMTVALPMGALPPCKLIEVAITKAMEAANSVISDANSGISAINGAGAGLPAGMESSSEGGAGGMEVSLAMDLGDSMKFEPPAKGFSNIHIGSFDSIGGVIASWADRQILEVLNKLLTLPTIELILPDFQSMFVNDAEEFMKLIEALKNNASNIGTETEPAPIPQSPSAEFDINKDIFGAAAAAEKEMVESYTNILNQVYAIGNAMPFVNINAHNIDFKIPWLSLAEIRDFERELNDVINYYDKKIQYYEDVLETYTCPDPDVETAECITSKILSIFVVDLDKFIGSLQENIEVVQSWMNFPRDFVLLKKQLADYIRALACYLDTFSTMLGGWLNTIQDQIIGYMEVILTIWEIIKNIKDLFDIFTNFEDNCDICTNERFANFGWYTLLGLVIPEIPIMKLPKWQDIVIDFSDMKAEINIEMPMIHFVLEPITLPHIPKIPLPDLPAMGDLKLLAQIPALPVLPKFPELPKLPPPPAIPKLDLPTLPPPPKLPEFFENADVLKKIGELIEMILNIWCMIKKSFAPVPEAYLSDHVVLLTNRPSYMIPLDMLKPKLGDIGMLETDFNELRIETTIYLGVRLKAVLKEVEKVAEIWNRMPTDFGGIIDRYIQEAVRQMTDALNEYVKLDDIMNFIENMDDIIEKEFEKYVQEKFLDEIIGDAFASLDDVFRGAEDALQGLSDSATEYMGEGMASLNQEMSAGIGNLQNIMNEAGEQASQDFRDWLSAEWGSWLQNPLQFMDDLEDWLEEEGISIRDIIELKAVDDLLHEKISEGIVEAAAFAKTAGMALEDWVNENSPEWLRNAWQEVKEGVDWLNSDAAEIVAEELRKAKEGYEEGTDVIEEGLEETGEAIGEVYEDWVDDEAYLPATDRALANVQQNLKDSLLAKFEELTEVIESANKSNLVDYKVIKEKLRVPDYHWLPQPNAADKINAMSKKLIAYSERLEGEAEEAKNTTDIFAYIQSQADAPLPFGLASAEERSDKELIFTSSIKPPKLLAQTPNPAPIPAPPTLPTTGSDDGASAICAGSCLVDPDTDRAVQFISHFDNPATTQTGFVPSNIAGQSHVLYNDAGNLYLKKNLAVPLDITTNIPPHVPNIIFSLDHFITLGNYKMPLKESINMMTAALTENGAATFTWAEGTHPDIYGYGIELEKTILGYDADKQTNNLADVIMLLLPPDENGLTPKVLVGGQTVKYGTLITSFETEEEAREVFGIEPKSYITGADKVTFTTVGNAAISLNPTRAVLFDKYVEPSYRISMDNGFYHIKATWFDKFGRLANYNRNELLSPQIYINVSPPIDILFEREFLVPVYKEKTISSGEIFTDLAGAYQYYWDLNQDGLPESIGDTLALPPQKEPKEISIDLIASVNIEDESFERFTKTFKVVVYVPKISLEPSTLKDEGLIKGTMEPLEESHDLSDIPFSVFRKRWGTWKNLGLLRKDANKPTSPPLSDKNNFKDNYYAVNPAGDYSISGLTKGLSNIIVRDEAQEDVVRVYRETGQIEILNPDYILQAIPASKSLPTRVSILKKGFNTVLSNIYYVSDENTDVVIRNAPLGPNNIIPIGVTIGDRNPNDTIIAHNIPGYGESYPGGASIFDDVTQTNIALINSDGAIRMMQRGYFLRLKNEGKLNEKVMFEIVDSFSQPIFDIFIGADFDYLEIRHGEIWSELQTTIGYLEEMVKPMFASLLAQNKPRIPTHPSAEESPFPDLDSTHPYFQQILDLYKRRIVSGYGDGSFKPDAKLSRAEFVKIALGSTKCFDCSRPSDPVKQEFGSTRPFPDVSLPAWYHYCIAIAKDIGMVTGYGDGYFRPNKNISRAEAVAILLRQSEIEIEEAPEEYFVDVPDYAWYKDYVYMGVEVGLIQDQDGFVFPDEEITRGEFAFMASGVLELQDCRLVDTDEDGMPDWWEMENNLDPFFAGDAALDNDLDNFTNLQEYKNGTDPNVPDVIEERCPCIDNPNQNDTDLDGIIDPCDEDLDGDGIYNTLCMFDENGLIDPAKAAESEDNCIFIINPGQEDYDVDGTGDTCIPIDQCPEVPEDLDGYHDLDGCPELDDETEDNPPGIYVNKGPLCYFLDYEEDLVKGDVIMTAITDVDTHEIIYEQSNEATY